MIVDKEGKLFEDRRKAKHDRRRKNENVDVDNRKKDRRVEKQENTVGKKRK